MSTPHLASLDDADNGSQDVNRLIRWGFFTALLSLLPLIAKAIFYAMTKDRPGVLADGSLLLTNALVGFGVLAEVLPAEVPGPRRTVNERSQVVSAGVSLGGALISALLYAYVTAGAAPATSEGTVRDLSIALAIPTFAFAGMLVALEKSR